MRLSATMLLLAGLALQDTASTLIPGEVTATKWFLSGSVEAEDDSEVYLRARRISRKWDATRNQFTEYQSQVTHLRAVMTVERKRFEGTLKPGPVGRYAVTISTDGKVLHSDRLALGSAESLFTRAPAHVNTILDVVDKSLEMLDHLEKIIGAVEPNSPRHREEFHRRVTESSQKLDEVFDETDFTATVDVFREVLFHIRNAQVWEEKYVPKHADNDPVRQRKKVFTDLEMTIEKLRKILSTVPEILSFEIKVSATLILERLIAQASDIGRLRDAARSSARAASKLAESSPVPDKDFMSLLDLASDRSTDPVEIRAQLLQAGLSLILK